MKKVQITLIDSEDVDTSRIERNIKQLSGVKNINVNLSSRTITANCEEYIGEDQLIATLRQAGYQVSDISFEKSTLDTSSEERDTSEVKETEDASDWLERGVWSWVFATPLLGILILQMFSGYRISESWILHALTLLLSLPIVFVVGWKVIFSGVQSFVSLAFDIDSLITLSSVTAYTTGILSLFVHVTDYSGTAGIMMAIFITGKYLEAKIRGESEKEIRRFTHLKPQSATILIRQEEIIVPLLEIQVGDILIARVGDHIAADGRVVKGDGMVEESVITGDETPQGKKPGDIILTGSVVQEGNFIIVVTSIGKNTVLSKVIKSVEEMRGAKIHIQRKIHTLTKVIVPIIMVLSVLSFVVWWVFTQDLAKALNTALAVLIIACPSSLALAIPTVLFIGSGIAAQRGILVRTGESFQALKEAKTIIFDKFGTLTRGTPEVLYVTSLIQEKELLEVAASLARAQNPILAKSLLERVGLRKYKKVEEYTFIPGEGIEGKIGKKKTIMGNRKMMLNKSIALKDIGMRVQEYEDGGKEALIVAINGKVVGVIAIADQLREDALRTIERLQRMQYKVLVMSNENEKTAHALEKKVRDIEVFSEGSPSEILKKIQSLKSLGGVAFVTSPGRNIQALKQSNVGIVIGTENDVGHGTEEILLTRESVSGVAEIAKLSREIQRKTHQNLFWAFGYNMVAIPLAALGLLHPLISEVAMIASTLSVIINANLLRNAKIS